MKVLVTGAAGFIGMHLALRLKRDGVGVIGADNFDPYYDVALKRARAQELARGFVERIRTGDVQHDPKGGDCPPWCELWRMCRIRRA